MNIIIIEINVQVLQKGDGNISQANNFNHFTGKKDFKLPKGRKKIRKEKFI